MEGNALKKVIARLEYEEGKSFLKNIESNESSKPNYKKWLVAASVVFLIGLSTFFVVQSNASSSPQDLYAQYFEPYPNNYKPVVRGQVDETTLAFMAYENKNYDEATHLFSKLLLVNEDDNVRFYFAISLLSQNKYDVALKELKKLEPLEFHYSKQVYWYKGLALLKINKIEDAKQILQTLKFKYPDFKTEEVGAILKNL